VTRESFEYVFWVLNPTPRMFSPAGNVFVLSLAFE